MVNDIIIERAAFFHAMNFWQGAIFAFLVTKRASMFIAAMFAGFRTSDNSANIVFNHVNFCDNFIGSVLVFMMGMSVPAVLVFVMLVSVFMIMMMRAFMMFALSFVLMVLVLSFMLKMLVPILMLVMLNNILFVMLNMFVFVIFIMDLLVLNVVYST